MVDVDKMFLNYYFYFYDYRPEVTSKSLAEVREINVAEGHVLVRFC